MTEPSSSAPPPSEQDDFDASSISLDEGPSDKTETKAVVINWDPTTKLCSDKTGGDWEFSGNGPVVSASAELSHEVDSANRRVLLTVDFKVYEIKSNLSEAEKSKTMVFYEMPALWRSFSRTYMDAPLVSSAKTHLTLTIQRIY